MVKIANKNIQVLTLDTEETFKRRVAASLKSLPEFIKITYITAFDDLKSQEQVNNVENFLDIVKQTDTDLDFLEFYDKVKTDWDISPKNILNLWLMNNRLLPRNSMYIFTLQEALKDREEFKDFSIDNFLKRDKELYISDLNKKIKEIEKEDKEWVKVASKFDKVKESEYTGFQVDKVLWKFQLSNETGLSLVEIFDNIKPNIDCPFIYFNDYYKIYSNIKVPSFWTGNVVDMINIKLYCKLDYYNSTDIIDENKFNSLFIDSFIYIQNNMLFLEIKSRNTSELSKEEAKNKIFSILQFKTNILQEFDSQLSGLFYFPRNKVDRYVLSDLIMNNDLYSIFMAIDESIKTSKKKAGLYVHFLNPSKKELGPVTASIVDKIAERSDFEVNTKSRVVFPYGSDFLRVKISRANTYDSIYDFISIFSKLITIYHSEENEVVLFYQKYIPSFIIKVGKVKEIKNRLKDINPELFLPNYSRLCLTKPTIIDENEIEFWEQKGHNVMLFPKTPEEGSQYYYVCTDPKNKYCGLRENTLTNNDKYTYIPCCFKMDQSTKNTSPFREYYYGEQMKEYTAQQRIMTTGKFAPFNKFAELPVNLKLLFESIKGENVEYLRKGVSRSKSSFLECVLEAIDENFITVLEEDRQRELIKIRQNLSKENLALCKQEIYDLEISDIKKLVLSSEEYLDPNLFIRLLSNYYDCNIYIFNRENEGQITIPRNSEGYYRYKPDLNKKTIFVYEHMGNESDRATYPQCELIIKWNKEQNIVDYIQGKNVTESIDDIFVEFNTFYTLTKKNHDIIFPRETLGSTRIEQVIDNNGKVRCLKIGNTEIFTSPIPPLNVKEGIIEFKKSKFSEVNNTLLKYVTITKYVIDSDDNVIELQGKMGNISISIPIEPTKMNTEDKIITDYSELLTDEESLLKLFNKNRRIASYIGENFIYLFSQYVAENNLDNLSDSIIEQFVNNKVIVDSKISDKYNLSITQFLGEGFIFRGNKIVIESENLLVKLVYNLKRIILRNRNKIFNYYTHKRMDNYYNDISDFKFYPNQTILYGKNSVEKWLSSLERKFILTNRIKPEEKDSYFFKNSLISENIYIARNVKTLKEAINILNKWYEKQDIQKYTLFLYLNRKNIPLNKLGDERILLKYKYNGEVGYTALLFVN